MRIIIAGSRGIKAPLSAVTLAMANCKFNLPLTVISGTAQGIDRAGEEWAESLGIEVERYPADWGMHGKSAGYKRNQLMAEKSDALVAVWDGKSRGTMHMIDIMKKAGKPVYVEIV